MSIPAFTNFQVTGTTYLAGNPVSVALSPTTSPPASGFVSATVTGTEWEATLNSSSSGTFFIIAELSNNPAIFVPSSSSIIITEPEMDAVVDRFGNPILFRDGTPITLDVQI